MKQYIDAIVKLLEPLTGLPSQQIVGMVAPSPKPEMGDLGFPCFPLAKTLKKAPPMIAAELAEQIGDQEGFSKIAAVGPYLNFTIDPQQLISSVLGAVRSEASVYGSGTLGQGKTVLIDFSSPNIAKPLAIHHIRSTIIGAALTRIYRMLGYNVVALNHLGDWGTNFGQLMVSYKREEEKNPGAEVDIHKLLQMYIQFHRDAHEDESLNEEAKAWFVKLEQGDEEAVRLWTLFCEERLKSFKVLYGRLGVEFDEYIGESHFNDLMEGTLQRIEEKGLSELSDGALVVKLDEEIPPCLLRKQDGSTLYATRDLAAAEYRHERWGF
ncbi:MAG: arginine--tRNA ligase domain-containing protein, partial [Planctomycetota bacterium]